MGIAIIIPNVNFADDNLGKVTPLSGVNSLNGITIVANNANSDSTLIGIQYDPVNTNFKGVNYSIVSGSSYCSINQEGMLSVNSGVDNKIISVKATSTSNPNISAIQNFIVSNCFSKTKNLADPTGFENGYYHKDTGVLTGTNLDYYRSTGLIPVELGKNYYISRKNGSSRVGIAGHITFWDKDGNFVSGYEQPTNNDGTIEVPTTANIKYMRHSMINNVSLLNPLSSEVQVELGTEASAYVAFEKGEVKINKTNDVADEGNSGGSSQPSANLSGIDIIATDVNAPTLTLEISYTPSNTTQKGVTFTMLSGADYASVSNDGVLSVNKGISAQTIEVKATSSANNAISDSQKFIVSNCFSKNKNLCDPNAIVAGYYDKDTGVLNQPESTYYRSTGLVPVELGKTYYISKEYTSDLGTSRIGIPGHITFWDKDGNFVLRYEMPTNNNGTIEVPTTANIKYMRHSLTGVNLSNPSAMKIQIEEGTEATDYVAFEAGEVKIVKLN